MDAGADSSEEADLVTRLRGLVRERRAIATKSRNGNSVGCVRLDEEGNEPYVRGLQGVPKATMAKKAKVRNTRLAEMTINICNKRASI